MTEANGGRRPLMEIVPNFSEGRRQDVIDAILAALLVPGVRLLNQQWDPDHNRLDASLVGSPQAVRASALAGVAKAAELIDMTEHHGSHPRMGAADVIPFLPIRDVTMEECVEMARDVGREIGERLEIPVYLYDRAATVPERASLAEVRKGEYEGLRDAVARGERLPDFGPHELGRAGAVAVGARKPLVAFNVYLTGTDEAGAKEIARRVRESTGGLKNVRAIGFLVPERGCVTVSMNLVDVDATPIYRAFELVRTEASRYGMEVLSSEIVGLVPAAAVAETSAFYLRLEGFDADAQVLELAMQGAEGGEADASATVGARTVAGYLDVVASDAPTPGGGAAAAVAGATGAALVAMVARLTVGRKGYEDVAERMGEIVVAADAGRAELLELADRDAEAFDGVMAAFKLPKATDNEKAARSAAIQTAMAGAAEVPLDVARRAADLMDMAREVTERGNDQAASDGAVAAQMLRAAVEGALYNVEINAASLKDEGKRGALASAGAEIRRRASDAVEGTAEIFERRILA
jgi:glutamate formiminotransferase / formiminotetrahydrofolate cyclodeaminase